MSPPPISRRAVLGLSAAAAVAAATAAATVQSASADETKEAKDVKPMVIECLADLNARK